MAEEENRQTESRRIQDDTAENPHANRLLRTSVLLFLVFVVLVAILALVLRLRSAWDEAPTRTTSGVFHEPASTATRVPAEVAVLLPGSSKSA